MTGVEFLREAPLRQARRFADAELRGDSTNLAWLHAHPILWMQALIMAENDVNDQLAKAKTDLAHLKPRAGESPTREYLTAKHEQDAQKAGRLHFKRVVERRRAELVTLFGPNRPSTVGEIVRDLVEAKMALEEDDVQAVRSMLSFLINKLLADAKRSEGAQ